MMVFNPLFLQKQTFEEGKSTLKPSKLQNSNYIFSDIIKVYNPDEQETTETTTAKSNLATADNSTGIGAALTTEQLGDMINEYAQFIGAGNAKTTLTGGVTAQQLSGVVQNASSAEGTVTISGETVSPSYLLENLNTKPSAILINPSLYSGQVSGSEILQNKISGIQAYLINGGEEATGFINTTGTATAENAAAMGAVPTLAAGNDQTAAGNVIKTEVLQGSDVNKFTFENFTSTVANAEGSAEAAIGANAKANANSATILNPGAQTATQPATANTPATTAQTATQSTATGNTTATLTDAAGQVKTIVTTPDIAAEIIGGKITPNANPTSADGKQIVVDGKPQTTVDIKQAVTDAKQTVADTKQVLSNDEQATTDTKQTAADLKQAVADMPKQAGKNISSGIKKADRPAQRVTTANKPVAVNEATAVKNSGKTILIKSTTPAQAATASVTTGAGENASVNTATSDLQKAAQATTVTVNSTATGTPVNAPAVSAPENQAATTVTVNAENTVLASAQQAPAANAPVIPPPPQPAVNSETEIPVPQGAPLKAATGNAPAAVPAPTSQTTEQQAQAATGTTATAASEQKVVNAATQTANPTVTTEFTEVAATADEAVVADATKIISGGKDVAGNDHKEEFAKVLDAAMKEQSKPSTADGNEIADQQSAERASAPTAQSAPGKLAFDKVPGNNGNDVSGKAGKPEGKPAGKPEGKPAVTDAQQAPSVNKEAYASTAKATDAAPTSYPKQQFVDSFGPTVAGNAATTQPQTKQGSSTAAAQPSVPSAPASKGETSAPINEIENSEPQEANGTVSTNTQNAGEQLSGLVSVKTGAPENTTSLPLDKEAPANAASPKQAGEEVTAAITPDKPIAVNNPVASAPTEQPVANNAAPEVITKAQPQQQATESTDPLKPVAKVVDEAQQATSQATTATAQQVKQTAPGQDAVKQAVPEQVPAKQAAEVQTQAGQAKPEQTKTEQIPAGQAKPRKTEAEQAPAVQTTETATKNLKAQDNTAEPVKVNSPENTKPILVTSDNVKTKPAVEQQPVKANASGQKTEIAHPSADDEATTAATNAKQIENVQPASKQQPIEALPGMKPQAAGKTEKLPNEVKVDTEKVSDSSEAVTGKIPVTVNVTGRQHAAEAKSAASPETADAQKLAEKNTSTKAKEADTIFVPEKSAVQQPVKAGTTAAHETATVGKTQAQPVTDTSANSNQNSGKQQDQNTKNSNAQTVQASSTKTSDATDPLKAQSDDTVTKKEEVLHANTVQTNTAEQTVAPKDATILQATELKAKTQQAPTETKQAAETVYKNLKPADMLHELRASIVSQDKQHVVYNLEPESLGKMRLLLETSQNSVSAHIEVETEAARQSVEANLQQLKQSLQQDGLQHVAIEVSLKNQDQKQQRSGSQRKTSQTVGQSFFEDEEAQTAEKRLGYNTYEYLA